MTKTISSIHDVVASVAFKSGGRFTPTLVRGPQDDEDTDLQRALYEFFGDIGVSVVFDPISGEVEMCRLTNVTEAGDGTLWGVPERVKSGDRLCKALRYVSYLVAGASNGELVIAF